MFWLFILRMTLDDGVLVCEPLYSSAFVMTYNKFWNILYLLPILCMPRLHLPILSTSVAYALCLPLPRARALYRATDCLVALAGHLPFTLVVHAGLALYAHARIPAILLLYYLIEFTNSTFLTYRSTVLPDSLPDSDSLLCNSLSLCPAARAVLAAFLPFACTTLTLPPPTHTTTCSLLPVLLLPWAPRLDIAFWV